MKILMMTNTYAPMVGGIEESIRSFTAEFQRTGHEVYVVASDCKGAPLEEAGIIRLPSIQNVNRTDFSIALPMSSRLSELLKTFKPDVIHCHHPFWMGDIALRLSSQHSIPLVFTYHTMFEQHMHYLPIKTDAAKKFIVELFTGFANLAHQVIVPSESVRAVLVKRGVTTPMEVIPTGIDIKKFSQGDGRSIRKRLSIPLDAAVIGYVGRLSLEKNLEFLSRSIAGFIKKEPRAHFVVAGDGPLKEVIKKIFKQMRVGKRLHFAGVLKNTDLVDFYHALNVFAFSSLSETQGIVLVEAMAARVPVVAIDAPGVREVVKDGYNGRLVYQENQATFQDALSWCFKQSPTEFTTMKNNANATTKEFAISVCAQKMLDVYQSVIVKEYESLERKNSNWDALVDRLRNEWDMFKNMIHAGGAAMGDSTIVEETPHSKKGGRLLKIPRLLSLSEWSARLLNLPRVEGVETEPGLIMIQIDGLSHKQLRNACQKNKMPFVAGLINKKYYRLHFLFPGLPSSTPAVQGELFYGVKQCVPAFAFVDRECGKIFKMYESKAVNEIEQRLELQGRGLLEGGSSYSNIYTGGSKEAHFCATSLGWGQIGTDVNPVSFIFLAITHFPSFVRMFVLTIWEIIIGIVDFFQGVFQGETLRKEFIFIYLRALICILLRELVVIGTKIDIARGLPIVHLNFLGYDELSHNRGPDSPSAYWALRGIDRAIENVYRFAMHARHRTYDVWVYSDHGQEKALSYATEYKRSVQSAIVEIFKDFDSAADLVSISDRGEQLKRAYFFGLSSIQKQLPFEFEENIALDKNLIVTAIGPTGNIYLPRKFNSVELRRFAHELVDKGKIPVVMLPEQDGTVSVFTDEGEFVLPQDAPNVLGARHPYLSQVTDDLIHLCHHPNAGDVTFMGFKPGKMAMTFPIENGSHAGPGLEETNAFALLPIDIFSEKRKIQYLRPTDLREAALDFLKNKTT
jgi:glycosyltransferase involved in cell wall biosynthesis